MDHVVVIETPDNMCNGISLADVAQELVAETLALGSAGNESSDVDELNDGGQRLLGVDEFRKNPETAIWNECHSAVRVDRRERIVLRCDLSACQRVEQR